MAAPSTAYHDKKKTFTVDTTDYDVYIARLLENTTPTTGDDWGDGYFNSTDSDAVKLDKICDIFKLDYITRAKEGSNEGFVGMIYSGSANYDFHNSSRHSRARAFDGNTWILLNDAGLNTKGTCSVGSAICRWMNFAKINLSFRSSFYNNTTNYGYKLNSGSNVSSGVLSAKQEKDKVTTILDVGVSQGNSFSIESYITNEEGTTTNSDSFVALEKIWYAGGAGMNTGNGNVWKLPSATTPLEDSYLYNATGGLSESYFYLDEFIALDDLPEQGGAPTETIIGYKDEQLGWGTNNKFAEGYYYIYNTLETGIPQYGDSMGLNGKVFHVNSQGEFDYYIEREAAIPFVEVTATVNSSTQVEIAATMYIMDNGVKTAFSNNLGSNIVIIGGAAWYGSVTAGGSPSGAKLVGSSFTPSSFSLTIYQGNSIAFPTTCTIDDLQDVPSGDPYIAMDTTSISPTPSSNTYVVRILADQYTY